MDQPPLASQRPGLPPFSPESPPNRPEEWDEALLRVESYLHAHRIPSRMAIPRLAAEVIEEARHSPQAGEEPPVTAAMAVLLRKMAGWYRGALEEGGFADESVRARGRLALVMTRSDTAWPREFLGPAGISAGLAQALRESRLEPGPEVRLTGMPPAPLEFSLTPAEVHLGPTLKSHGLLQAAAIWVLILGAMGVAWAENH